jgi:PAS domain S-box-containing protein
MIRDSDATHPLRALLVENDEADAELVAHALRQLDRRARIDLASNRKEFTALLAANEYDIVLADYRLPNWTGMEALKELRHLGFDIPLIVVTGTLGDERAVECVKFGAADYVLKGNLSRLQIAARRAIDEKRARDESLRADLAMRMAQDEARDREERFHQLAENIDEVFFIMDAQFRETLYINAAYEKIWGQSCQSLYDNPASFLEPLPSDDRVRLQDHIRRIQRGELGGKLEFRIDHKDGSVRWVTIQAVPIRNEDGEVYRISGVALDITESREARLALEESAERFRMLTEASFDAIALSQHGEIREVNQGFLHMFGYDRMDEVIGRPISEFIAEESRGESDRRVSTNREGMYELMGERKDGKKLLLDATARIQRSRGAESRITALRDVTEKRALENQFRQSQKMEAVGRLAGGVAHDFNNLLTVILSYTDMLIEGVAPKDPRAEDLDQIRKAGLAAATLTRQLLAFSRQQVIEPRLVDLNEIVNSSDKLLRRLIGEDIQLEAKLGGQAFTVMIDPGQLEQVIMNLAVNARDAMPAGGKLTLETTAVTMDGDYVRDHWPAHPGRFAMLAVSDTGCGMNEETRSRIFEPFFTTKSVGEGTGLGLATVYGIVKQSNGFIWVYSEPNEGTTFKIYFPLVDRPADEYVERPEPATIPTGTETILLAEDSPAVRVAVRQILERFGYTVIEAPNGKVALSAAERQSHIDLLLTDVVMPEMSGRQLAEEFSGLRPAAKILFMSGYTDDAIIRHGVLRPGTAYIQKPFSAELLARKVRETLDRVPAQTR